MGRESDRFTRSIRGTARPAQEREESERLRTGGGTRPCESCGRPTRDGKPFCPDHLEHNLHASTVIARLRALEEEGRAILDGDPRRPSPLLGQTLLERLVSANGPMNLERLARELALDLAVVRSVARWLSRCGHVRIKIDSRSGVVFVVLLRYRKLEDE